MEKSKQQTLFLMNTSGKVVRPMLNEENPHYKIMLRGKAAMTDMEIVSLIVSNNTGSKENAKIYDLVCKLFVVKDHSLINIAQANIQELTKYGFSELGAKRLSAAFELGKRRYIEERKIGEKMTGSVAVYEEMYPLIGEVAYEEFWILILNRANRIIKKIQVSEGGLSGTVADPKKIFTYALEYKAAAIILCHNHPSGNIKPSNNDINLTKKMKQAGSYLDLPVLDHLIISGKNYFSFADEGMI